MPSEPPRSPRGSGAEPRPDKSPKRVVRIGKYEVVKHIATGGMGAVYRARDVETGADVALKVLPQDMAAKAAMLERFKREARSASRLDHENIVRTIEFGEYQGINFLAMEYIDGVDLHDYVKRKGTLDPEEARQIILQGARALRAADAQCIVHRDIKPSNFLLTRTKTNRPVVKLTDFGLAREVDADEFRVTRAGTTVGTVDYMSPEQARDSSAADIRSDLYSLGSTWYHLLVGHAPFPDGGLGERLIKLMNDPPPDPRELNPRISSETWFVLGKLLAKDPAERYQSPAELIDDLLALEGSTVARPKPDSRAQKKAPRKKGKSKGDTDTVAAAPTALISRSPIKVRYLVACAAFLLVGIIVAILGFRRQPPKDSSVAVLGPDQGGEPVVVEGPGKKQPIQIVPPVEKQPTPVVPVRAPRFPQLYKPAAAIDVKALRQEVEAPWARAAPPADAFVARVGRLGGAVAGSFRTLSDACAVAPAGQAIIIEIHDNGPLFEMPFAVAGRDLTIRAAKGFRPLVVWDLTATLNERTRAKKTDQPLVLARAEKGRLALEGVELAVRWPETLAEPATLFDAASSDLALTDCTVSVLGKARGGVTLARFHGERDNACCRLTRCQVRGAGLMLLDLDAIADVLLDGCLIVGGMQPLLRVRAGADKGPRLRAVRSTLVCGQTLLEVKKVADLDRSPALAWLGWDSLIGRCGSGEGGEMLVLPAGADTDGMTWRSVNTLYAGWRSLLAGGKTIPGDDAREWQRNWKRIEGDVAVRDPWPDQVFIEPATQPAGTYQPTKPVAFGSTVDPDAPLGCDLAALPPARDAWPALAFEPALVPADVPVDSGAPEIPNLNDGKFHGARLDLRDVDLGAWLEQLPTRVMLGPRVVLHLAGKGDRLTSPIRLKGSTLVLYFEPPPEKDKDPERLSLRLKPTTAPVPLIDVEGGGLEVIGGVLRGADSGSARYSHLVRVKGGDVKLYRTRLEGPQQAVPEGYQAALSFIGSGDPAADKMASCALSECVVVSSRACVLLDGVGTRLHVRQSLLLSGGEALHLMPGAACKGKAGMHCVLENVTLAGRSALVRLGDAPAAGVPAEPIVVQARDCAYLNPFPGKPSKGGMLLSEGDALARGLLLWQGERDGFDARLYFATARAGALPAAKEGNAPWRRVWGAGGVRSPRAELRFNLRELDGKRWALDRLVLPVNNPPGADMKLLDIPPKKKAKPR
jgi:serine/threonine protein kinase